jgi:arginyl-tRNA synthetase
MERTAEEMSREHGKNDELSPEEQQHLYHILALGALKYFILKVDPTKNMLFNPAESIDFNGNTGPFIQYTHARIKSVLRKCGEDYNAVDISAVVPNEKETSLIQKLADFTVAVADAGRNYSPALIANYIYDLAKEYNQFYHDCSILKEQDGAVRAFRLLLSATVADVICRGMSLLGIEVPERM